MTFPYLVFIFTAVYFSFKPYYMFLLFLDWKQKQKNAFFSQVNSRVFFLSHAWVFDGFKKWQLDIFQFLVF